MGILGGHGGCRHWVWSKGIHPARVFRRAFREGVSWGPEKAVAAPSAAPGDFPEKIVLDTNDLSVR